MLPLIKLDSSQDYHNLSAEMSTSRSIRSNKLSPQTTEASTSTLTDDEIIESEHYEEGEGGGEIDDEDEDEKNSVSLPS
jgi:hypothetical protein